MNAIIADRPACYQFAVFVRGHIAGPHSPSCDSFLSIRQSLPRRVAVQRCRGEVTARGFGWDPLTMAGFSFRAAAPGRVREMSVVHRESESLEEEAGPLSPNFP